MFIWLLVVLLMAGFAVLGYFKGAIRMIFPLLGLFVGALLALPLSPLVQPLVPLVGLQNPIWSVLIPPVIVFFVVALLLVGVGFLVHWKLNTHFKFRTDEYTFSRWHRLNQRLGVSMGILAGVVYSLLVGVVIYVLGYLTVQVSAGERDTAAVRYLNQLRADLRSSGLEQLAAALDPAPRWYYTASDILGLLYHNSLLHSRLAAYPPLLILAERPEFQAVARDSAYQNMLATQASVAEIVQDPKTQAILANEGLLAELQQLDLEDLYTYLRTGESEIFRDRPILGRWEVDPYATMLQEKRRRSQMTTSEMLILRHQMELLNGLRLIVAPDQTVKLQGPDVAELYNRVAELGVQIRRSAPTVRTQLPTTGTAAGGGAFDSLMAERYGTMRPSAPTPTQPSVPMQRLQSAAGPSPMSPQAIEEEFAQLSETTLAQGRWEQDGVRYRLTVRPQRELHLFGGRNADPVIGTIRDGRLYLTRARQTLVLDRF
jgi:uncharacterized membrane protein required for colicin V production